MARMALIQLNRFWRDVNVRSAWGDLRTVIEQAGSNKWRFALLSAVCTIAVFSVMWQEGGRGLPKPPTVTYITSWPADRSEAEIVASNIANQKRKEKLAAEQAQREAEVREIYKKIGRYSGMDVDAIEKKAEAERRAEEARKVASQPKTATQAKTATPSKPAGESKPAATQAND